MPINLQVARTCNLRCSFCSHDKWVNPKGFMDYELFADVLAKIKTDGCDLIVFCSAQGESLLHPRIFDMLDAALATGIPIHLVTNGTPLNERRIDRLASMGLAAIQVSFCGYDKESYEALYVGAKFEQVTRNLVNLFAAVRVAGQTLVINGVVDTRITHELCEPPEFLRRTAELLISLGAEPSWLRFQLPHNWGGTVAAGSLDDGKQIYSHRDISAAPLKICPMLSTPGVYVDGRVTACGCIDANGALEIGDLTKQSLSEIRAGDRNQAILAAFRQGDVSGIPLCSKCEIPYEPDTVIGRLPYTA